MSKTFTEVLLWFFMGCIVVLIVTHAPGFSQAVTTVGNVGNQWGTTLTGTGVNNAVYSQSYLK